MKKIFIVAFLSLFLASQIFASAKGLFSGSATTHITPSNTTSSKGFFSSKVNLTGIWKCQKDDVKYVLIIRKNGSMEILRKQNDEKNYWRGIYTTFLKDISFKVTESGHRVRYLQEELYDENAKWLINCKTDRNNPDSITLKSKNITEELISEDFSSGLVFTK